jgi:hypothetical protein
MPARSTRETYPTRQTRETRQTNLSGLARLMAGQWKKGAIPPKWDGKAVERVVEIVEQVLV